MIHLDNEKDKQIVLECLKAAINGSFFPDLEFPTLMAVDRTEVADIIANWKDIKIEDESVQLAINNIILNLLGYPHKISDAKWASFISVSPHELKVFFRKIKNNVGKNYFDNLM